ncbi:MULTISPECIES: M24 family metallopeptidase [Halomonadaceae]|uniref:M24 family metallopeptidase n=1 Tax=Halomonadaceae TaxID=28256 RepID=UPI0012F20B3E|nr:MULTISPECIES: Xaa-Pro peptidase family protein [Halomonas]CAD5259072.1 Peptidase M24, structural domain [Halomonas sp. 59]CAD5259341.1 Peptidase M24, structural domain [Halomonas sp. 113]CAD5273286.1 Peptidase M24, structural domain [Halomonas sp. I3]CAD5289378.1 Peptidase M24, structural domain [Halomonas sp. 156]VXB33950.1 Peptidase M24, structural domain [Halomonas titanicae]
MDYHHYRTALAETLAQSELPFPTAEYQVRLDKVRNAMAEHGLDALLLTDPADINYLTGYHTFEVSVHACLVCTQARLVLQVASIETGAAVVTARVDEIIGYRWENLDEIITPLADLLSPCSKIGIDGWSSGLRFGVIDALMQTIGRERFSEAGTVVDAIRIVKSPAELEMLQESARITALGLETAIQSIRPGMTDNDIAAVGAKALLENGSEFMSLQPIVTSGHRIGVIHVNHKRRVIQPNEPVFLEFGAAYQRYTAPMMRTAVTGAPNPALSSTRDLCRSLFEALCDAMRPGNTFDAAAQAADALLAPQRDQYFFSGVFGYAVGAQFPPSWVEGTGFIAKGQARTFETNMVFHLPLCLRVPGQWGVGISDTVVVTENGAKPLTNNDWQLFEASS